MTLDLRRMRYFRSIAEQGSFTGAAAELNVAQPALSQHMASLEKHLGVSLFTRAARGVSLTEAGTTLLAHVAVVMRSIEAAETAVRERANEPSGDVVLSLLNSVSVSLTVPVLRQCKDRFPGINLIIVEGNSQTVQAGVQREEYDLAVNISSVVRERARPLADENLLLLGAPDLLPECDHISLADALKTPLILPTKRHGVRKLLEGAALQLNTQINLALEMDGVAAVKAAMVAGLGTTVLGRSAVQNEESAGLLVVRRIVDPPLQRRLVLHKPRNRPETHAVREVEKIVLDTMEELGRSGYWTCVQ